MNNIEELIKIEFIKKLKPNNYKFYCSYSRIEDIKEIIWRNYSLSLKDSIEIIKIDSNTDYIFFINDKIGIIMDFVFIEKNNKFELYEMNLDSWNEFEKFLKNFQI